jgi:hypothetical protein
LSEALAATADARVMAHFPSRQIGLHAQNLGMRTARPAAMQARLSLQCFQCMAAEILLPASSSLRNMTLPG